MCIETETPLRSRLALHLPPAHFCPLLLPTVQAAGASVEQTMGSDDEATPGLLLRGSGGAASSGRGRGGAGSVKNRTGGSAGG